MSIATNFPTIKPSLSLDFANTGVLDPRITFARASTATYYDGVTTAKAEENLLKYSQEFQISASWGASNSTISADTAETTAPDGTSTADKLLETAVTNTHIVFQGNVAFVSGQAYTFSVFAKKAERNFVVLQLPSGAFGTDTRAFFNLDTGAVGTTTNSPTTSITSAGNGWYRCAITKTATSSATPNNVIYVAETDGVTSYAGIATNGIYLWGAQIEQRSAVSSYTPTTTQPIVNYIPVLQTAASGVARFDHNPTTSEALGLLIEEQRTNLLTYSSDFSNAAWSKGSSTVKADTIVAPDGTLTGDCHVPNSGSAGGVALSYTASTLTFTAGVSYTGSIYAKAAGFTTITLLLSTAATSYGGVGGNAGATFDLSNGTYTRERSDITANIYSVGNGWYRCTLTFTPTTTGSFPSQMPRQPSAGNGYNGVFIWNAQLEAGAFATSAIQTTSAQVTRQADAASMTGTNFSSWYNAGEGAYVLEFSYPYTVPSTNFPNIFTLSDGTVNNRIISYVTGSTTRVDWNVTTAGSTQVLIVNGSDTTANSLLKNAVAFELNNFAYSLNGATALTDTSGTIPFVSQLNIGSNQTPGGQLNGHIRKVSYYPQRLSNANLQALTS